MKKNGSHLFSNNCFYPFLEFDKECLEYVILGERISREHKEMLGNFKSKGLISASLLSHTFD